MAYQQPKKNRFGLRNPRKKGPGYGGEIDCKNWLARGYIPARQLCEFCYPPGRGCAWAVRQTSSQNY